MNCCLTINYLYLSPEKVYFIKAMTFLNNIMIIR